MSEDLKSLTKVREVTAYKICLNSSFDKCVSKQANKPSVFCQTNSSGLNTGKIDLEKLRVGPLPVSKRASLLGSVCTGRSLFMCFSGWVTSHNLSSEKRIFEYKSPGSNYTLEKVRDRLIVGNRNGEVSVLANVYSANVYLLKKIKFPRMVFSFYFNDQLKEFYIGGYGSTLGVCTLKQLLDENEFLYVKGK